MKKSILNYMWTAICQINAEMLSILNKIAKQEKSIEECEEAAKYWEEKKRNYFAKEYKIGIYNAKLCIGKLKKELEVLKEKEKEEIEVILEGLSGN